ncbi:J domain-containing protein [Rhodococcus wratislaviensis]|nr:J domain-containing protein [Rhodococcus sp. 3A]MBC2894490.1 J domain-containing protein [Rhodococcus sp. 4CII]
MATEQDPYRVLGLPSSASQAEIASAYRRLLREHHPDTRDSHLSADPASDEHLQQVLTAYALLRDPEHRSTHDQVAADGSTAEEAAAEPESRPGPAPGVRSSPTIPARIHVVIDAHPPRRPPATGLWVGPVRRHR